MAGELRRIRQANQDRYLRVFNPGDIHAALMLLERAAGVILEVQNITGQDYGIDEMCAASKRELVPVYSGPDLRIGDRVFLRNGHEVEVYGLSEESGVRTSGGIFRLSELYRKFESKERNDHDLRKLQAETALYHQYARAIAEARELLQLVEWWGPYLNPAWELCPACGAPKHEGHVSDCKLAAWLGRGV